MQVPDIPRDEFMWNFHLNDPTSETHQDSTCPPINFLKSWRSWRFLINLEVVSDDRDHPSEASVKVSWRSNNRNYVKTPPILQVSSWSLEGCVDSWWTWRFCHMIGIILQKLLWKFHQDLTSETLSRPPLSSKSLPGVLEDVEVPDTHGDGLREASMKVLWKLDLRKQVKTSPVLQVSSWSLWGHGCSWRT